MMVVVFLSLAIFMPALVKIIIDVYNIDKENFRIHKMLEEEKGGVKNV